MQIIHQRQHAVYGCMVRQLERKFYDHLNCWVVTLQVEVSVVMRDSLVLI